jgi:hypothetical protein
MRKARKVSQFGRTGRRSAKCNEYGVTKFEIAKLELHKGDILVLRTDFMLTQAQVKELSRRARPTLPKGIKLMILSHGLSLAVLEDKRGKVR